MFCEGFDEVYVADGDSRNLVSQHVETVSVGSMATLLSGLFYSLLHPGTNFTKHTTNQDTIHSTYYRHHSILTTLIYPRQPAAVLRVPWNEMDNYTSLQWSLKHMNINFDDQPSAAYSKTDVNVLKHCDASQQVVHSV